MKKIVWFFIFYSLSGFSMDCSDPNLALWPVQGGGRIKPLAVHSHDVMEFLVGKKNLKKINVVSTYCEISWGQYADPYSLSTPIEHEKTRTLLQQQEITFAQLKEKEQLMVQEYQKLLLNDGYKKEINKLLSRLDTLEKVISGQDWVFYQKDQWKNLKSLKEINSSISLTELHPSVLEFQQKVGKKYLLEYYYFKIHFFGWSMLTVLLALIFFIFRNAHREWKILTSLTLSLEIVAIIMRILISGRAPITNMYETVMFSGTGALIIALIISRVTRERFFVVAGLAYNFLCLMMLNFAHGMLSPSISPLVPVLRDNFWLSIHVTTVISSYGALALSWVLANTIIIREKFFALSAAEKHKISLSIYTCLKVGVILLSAGVILGGLWADYSWGRFWGWDPKETWSLIVLITYMAILHGRYTSWIPENRFIPLVAGAFLTVMMAWFGVNYILASGLHSYGFSEGGAIFLGSFFLAQIILLVLPTKKKLA